MPQQIFVGNLPHSATEDEIRSHFGSVGSVTDVSIKRDRKGRSRCFCFLEMENAEEAVDRLEGSELNGRKLRVSKARELETRRPYYERRFRR